MIRLPWRRLSARESGAPPPPPREVIPPSLEGPLRKALLAVIADEEIAGRVGLRLELDLYTGRARLREQFSGWEGEHLGLRDALAWTSPKELLYDVIDAVLHLHPDHQRVESSLAGTYPADTRSRLANLDVLATVNGYGEPVFTAPPLRQAATALEAVLADGNSAYRVSDDQRELQRRIAEPVQAAAAAARNAAADAGRHEAVRDLQEAWSATYGRQPRPSEAYRLAIRAVEDVAIPVVIPADTGATLGKVRASLANGGHKWRLSMTGDVEPLVTMISLLWTGQTDRHAGQVDLARVDEKAAEQAVHLATTLVQWFAAGHVQRLP